MTVKGAKKRTRPKISRINFMIILLPLGLLFSKNVTPMNGNWRFFACYWRIKEVNYNLFLFRGF
jgi:hypothetical protein